MCAQADWRIGGKANDQWSHVWMEGCGRGTWIWIWIWMWIGMGMGMRICIYICMWMCGVFAGHQLKERDTSIETIKSRWYGPVQVTYQCLLVAVRPNGGYVAAGPAGAGKGGSWAAS